MTHKEKYQFCKENGICVSCHKRNATHGVRCEECYNKHKIYAQNYDKETYNWRKEKGYCVKCGKEKAVNGTLYCLVCLMDKRGKYKPLVGEKKIEKQQKNLSRYYQNKENGVCVQCGKRPSNNSVFCDICKSRKRYKEELKRRRNGVLPKDTGGNGIYCAICLKPVETQGKKLCNRCYENSINSIKIAQQYSPVDNYFRKLHYARSNND